MARPLTVNACKTLATKQTARDESLVVQVVRMHAASEVDIEPFHSVTVSDGYDCLNAVLAPLLDDRFRDRHFTLFSLVAILEHHVIGEDDTPEAGAAVAASDHIIGDIMITDLIVLEDACEFILTSANGPASQMANSMRALAESEGRPSANWFSDEALNKEAASSLPLLYTRSPSVAKPLPSNRASCLMTDVLHEILEWVAAGPIRDVRARLLGLLTLNYHWYQHTLPFLYRRALLAAPAPARLFAHNLLRERHLGLRVRELQLVVSPCAAAAQTMYHAAILKLCPNVRSVTIRGCDMGWGGRIWMALREATVLESLWLYGRPPISDLECDPEGKTNQPIIIPLQDILDNPPLWPHLKTLFVGNGVAWDTVREVAELKAFCNAHEINVEGSARFNKCGNALSDDEGPSGEETWNDQPESLDHAYGEEYWSDGLDDEYMDYYWSDESS